MTEYIDVLMTKLPGPDGEFVETEDDQGRGVGSDHGLHWVKDGDMYRLRIPRAAFDGGKHRADKAGREFAMKSLLENIGHIAGEYEGRAARLREFRQTVQTELDEKGIEEFCDSSFLVNVVRELLDSTRQTHHMGMASAIGFASIVQNGRP